MQVAVHMLSTPNKAERDILWDFAKSINKFGDVADLHFDGSIFPDYADYHVIWGSWKPRDDEHHRVKNEVVRFCKRENAKFICIETPLLGRKKVENVMSDVYHRIGVNGFLADTGNFNNVNSPSDRWIKIQKDLEIDVKPWRTEGDRITIALQLPGDASLRGANISKWAYETAKDVKEILLTLGLERRIVVRTPQLQREFDQSYIDGMVELGCEFEVGTKENLLDSFKDCWVAFTYSSGYAVDAVVNGVPVIACDPGSFAYDISSSSVDALLDPKMVNEQERMQWLYDLSYAQWHQKELKNGKVWEHLRGV